MPASSNKPYRVYRQPRLARGDGSIRWTPDEGRRDRGEPSGARRSRGAARTIFRYVRRLLYVVILVGAVWGAIAYHSFSTAVEQRNRLVPANVRKVLTPADGPAITTAQNILLIGTDRRKGDADRGRSDSMILVRVDVPRRRYAMLSIPRDLRAEIPDGYGQEKINSAYSLGGPALAIRTVSQYTNVPINHYMLIDFSGFAKLVDGIGGVYVVNPRPLRSYFDGKVWNFNKGKIRLNGRRALAYARVRKNDLYPNESDLTRGARQQQVIDAIAEKLLSTDSLLHPRGYPRAAVQPLTTEVSASQLITFAFAKVWAKPENVLRCRLGGEIEYFGGSSYIVGDELNRAVVRMWLGRQPPLKPNVQANQFAPGCTRAGR